MIIPARSTPHITATTLDLKSISRRLAARVPVQAPVPGSGMPTNNKSKKSPACLGLKLLAALLAFLKAKTEKSADDRLISSPDQYLSRKQKDKRDRQHIADNGCDIGRQKRKAYSGGIKNGAAEFNQRHH